MSIPHFAKCTKDIGEADQNDNVKFRIVLNVRNEEWLKNKLEEVSNPQHPNYGKHATREELAAQTNPTSEDVDKVCNYLSSKGVKFDRHGSDVEVNTTVKVAEDLFNTKLHKFTQPEHDASTKDFIIHRTGGFTVPGEFASVVSMVSGI